MARSQSGQRSRSISPTPSRRDSSINHDTRSPERSRSGSRSRSRTPDPRERSRSRSRPRTPEHHYRNGYDRSYSRSRSPSRDGRRSYRERSRSHSRGRRPQSSKIVVEKLTKNVTEAHLQEIFGSYGRISSIDLPMNRQFMTNRGTAYIMYENSSSSESAIAHMHEAQLDGAVITVSIVLPRRAFSRSPPPVKSARPPFQSRFNGPREGSYRSPPSRRGGFGGRRPDWDDPHRNRSLSRSVSPQRRRDRSDSISRSPSRTPPRKRKRSPPRRRRRSPSYSSYSSRSRSRSRSPSRSRYSGRR